MSPAEKNDEFATKSLFPEIQSFFARDFPLAFSLSVNSCAIRGRTLLSREIGTRPLRLSHFKGLCVQKDNLQRVSEGRWALEPGFESCFHHLLGAASLGHPFKDPRTQAFFSEMKDDTICLSSLDGTVYVKALSYM